MKQIILTALLAAAPLCFGAVDGVVINRTTGKPEPGVALTLVKLGAGMEQAGAVKTDAKGAFHMDATLAADSPYLLQAQFEGVSYNKMLTPGSPATGLEAEVYNSSAKPVDTAVTQHMILLEPSDKALSVNESIVFQNSGKQTFNDPTGTLHFYVPSGAGEVSVQVKGPGGMPVTRPAEKGKRPNEYAVNYPVRPGETTFAIGYSLNATKAFQGKILHAGGPVRIVVPKGVTLKADNLSDLGVEPRTQATIYEVKGNEYKVAIEGTGSLRAAAEAATAPAASDAPDDKIDEVKPRVYSRLYWILGFVAMFLISGFIILYRSQPVERKR